MKTTLPKRSLSRSETIFPSQHEHVLELSFKLLKLLCLSPWDQRKITSSVGKGTWQIWMRAYICGDQSPLTIERRYPVAVANNIFKRTCRKRASLMQDFEPFPAYCRSLFEPIVVHKFPQPSALRILKSAQNPLKPFWNSCPFTS